MPADRPYESPPLPEYPGGRIVAALLIFYVVAVLAVDTLATLRVQWFLDWSMFQWRPRDIAPLFAPVLPRSWLEFLASPRASVVDLFKITFWFVVPVLLSWRWMDWGAWGWDRWRMRDFGLLFLGLALGLAAILLIPYLPGVRDLYQSSTPLSPGQKWIMVISYTAWCAAWLPGWEFLHRYVLVAALGKFLPRGGWGWLVVPLLVATTEAAYHLVKPWPETLGMFAFGFFATLWAYHRSNFLLPFLVHLFIEMALIIFIVVNA